MSYYAQTRGIKENREMKRKPESPYVQFDSFPSLYKYLPISAPKL